MILNQDQQTHTRFCPPFMQSRLIYYARHEAARSKYDIAVCQYHDQALIPLKALHFDSGVNMTLGLPIVRTSPDHGTAFNIAGKGIADPQSMIAAIQMAETAWHHRQNYDS